MISLSNSRLLLEAMTFVLLSHHHVTSSANIIVLLMDVYICRDVVRNRHVMAIVETSSVGERLLVCGGIVNIVLRML